MGESVNAFHFQSGLLRARQQCRSPVGSRAPAGFIGMPSMLGQIVKRISFGNYTLPPTAFTKFCMRYADQSKPQRILSRGGSGSSD
jgi:hypothetical protein